MNNLVGPLVVLALGGIAGVCFHMFWRRFWVASLAAMLTAAFLWIGGCYVLFAFTAPNELGWPALGPILLTMAIAFAGALVAGCGVCVVRTRPPSDAPSSGSAVAPR